jgi:hypothetical protein
MTLLWNDSGK